MKRIGVMSVLVLVCGCGGEGEVPSRGLIEASLEAQTRAGCLGGVLEDEGELHLAIEGWMAEAEHVAQIRAFEEAGLVRETRRESRGSENPPNTIGYFVDTQAGREAARSLPVDGRVAGKHCFSFGALEIEPNLKALAVDPAGELLGIPGATIYSLPVRYRVVDPAPWVTGTLAAVFAEKLKKEAQWQEIEVPLAKTDTGWHPVS